MDQQGPPTPRPPSATPLGAPPPPPPYYPPQQVHITARPSGFSRAIGFMFGLFLFGLVFILGIGFGLGSLMMAGTARETVILRQVHRKGASSDGNIAILPVEGVIDARQAAFVRAAVAQIINDGSVDAVILRVNSPGGGVTESDQIWYEVERLKTAGLPVIASYGGIAASGGYYVSCAADEIFAEPTCITGSIGVIAQIFTFEQLMEKIGVEPVTMIAADSPNKDVANDVFRAWNDQDRQTITTMLDAAYGTFSDRVRNGRQATITSEDSLSTVADGSIFTAQAALDNGLIDTIGYLDDAIAKAEQVAGIRTGRSNVFILREPPSLFGDGLLGQAGAMTTVRQPLDADRLRSLLSDLASPRVMYLMK